MKRLLVIFCIVFVTLLVPAQQTHAQYETQEDILAALQDALAELKALQNALAELQKQPQVLGAKRHTFRASVGSQYYDGRYTGLYTVVGGKIVPYNGTVTQVEHEVFFARFKNIFADTNPARITEFRVYDDRDSEYDAFIEQFPGGHDWMFGVNTAYLALDDQEDGEIVTELFIHEYAHIVHYYNPNIADAFEEAFWSTHTKRSRNFVSEYAMENAEEDFAESFAHFVLKNYPGNDNGANKKIRFFYNYRHFIELRNAMRDRL